MAIDSTMPPHPDAANNGQDFDDDEASDAYSVAAEQAVILVDPYSTGCLVGKEIYKRGYALICLWTAGFSEDMKTHVPQSAGVMTYHAEVTEIDKDLEATAQACRDAAGHLQIVACLAGGEAGVDLADALSEHMQMRTNGTEIPNRRDKKVQQELIRKAGLRSVRQAGSDKFEEVESFLKTEPFPVVLKPTESAGSDGVKLCNDFHEAKEHFDVLMKSQLVNGGDCPAVLCELSKCCYCLRARFANLFRHSRSLFSSLIYRQLNSRSRPRILERQGVRCRPCISRRHSQDHDDLGVR